MTLPKSSRHGKPFRLLFFPVAKYRDELHILPSNLRKVY